MNSTMNIGLKEFKNSCKVRAITEISFGSLVRDGVVVDDPPSFPSSLEEFPHKLGNISSSS